MTDSIMSLHSDIHTGRVELVTSTNNILLGESMKATTDEYRQWLVGKGKSKNTRDRYVNIYDDFLEHLVSRGKNTDTKEGIAEGLTKDDVESFETKMGNRPVKNPKTGELGIYDQNSMRQIRSGINKILVYYDRKDLKLEVGRRVVKEQRCPTREEVDRMLEALKSNPTDHMKLMLLIHTGRRKSAVMDLLDEDVNCDTQHITFRTDKGKVEASVWIPRELADEITEYRKNRTTPKPKTAKLLLISTLGNHVNRADMDNVVKRGAVGGKINWKIHPHSFRHFKNEDMRRKGADPEERRKFMGWKSLAMVQNYSHDTQEEIDAMAERTAFRTIGPAMTIENASIGKDPIDQIAVATDKFLRGEMTETTYNRVMNALGSPLQETLQ